MINWRSVLIESGGWKNNYEKQFIRKMNFIALMVGFQSISHQYYIDASIDKYEKIPENKRRLFDVMLRNAFVEYNGNKYLIDLGINQHEVGTSDNRDDYFRSTIDDVGDLSTFYGYDEFNLEGMTLAPGKVYPEPFDSLESLDEIDFFELYEQGYTYIKLINMPDTRYIKYPVDVIKSDDDADFG